MVVTPDTDWFSDTHFGDNCEVETFRGNIKQINIELIFTGTVHINQSFSKSAGFSQPATFQPQSLGRLLKTITI
jgi:hypothetical protein